MAETSSEKESCHHSPRKLISMALDGAIFFMYPPIIKGETNMKKYKIVSALGTILASFEVKAFAERYLWEMGNMGIRARIEEL